MKNTRTLIIILLITLMSNLMVSGKNNFQSISKLSELVKQDKYSDLYSELLKNSVNYKEESLLFYDIILKSVMNQPEKSNRLINKFRSDFSDIDDTTNYYITQAEYDNYLKLCNYKKLKEIGSTLISKYKGFIDSNEYVELQYDNVRYFYLENEKSISLIKKADTKLKIKKDLAGYTLLTVKGSNDSTIDFIFDTGANVNAITQSTAKKMNVRIIPGSKVYVMGATGARNEGQEGMADRMTIGNMEVHNVEFVVFADSLFTFAGGRYIMHGVIGFPVFNRFEEIAYTDSTLSIPQTPTLKAGKPNMFIKSDDYILAIEYKNNTYPFFFDTGNGKSYFTKNFYTVDSAYFNTLKDTIFTYGGIGGISKVKAKQPEEISLSYSGKNIKLVKPYVELEYDQISRDLYGNIGKDFMNFYKTKVMSFKEARLEFE